MFPLLLFHQDIFLRNLASILFPTSMFYENWKISLHVYGHIYYQLWGVWSKPTPIFYVQENIVKRVLLPKISTTTKIIDLWTKLEHKILNLLITLTIMNMLILFIALKTLTFRLVINDNYIHAIKYKYDISFIVKW